MQASGPVCLRLVPLSPSEVVSLGHATVQRVHVNSAGRGPGQAGVGTSAVAAVRDAKAAFCAHPSAGIRPSRCHGDRASPWPRPGLLFPELHVGRL